MQSNLPMQGLLLISDIDGTLITRDFVIPPRNIEAIGRFKREGGLFAVATGRAETSSGRYVAKVNTNAPSILYNGSMIYDFSSAEAAWAAYVPERAHGLVGLVHEAFPDVGIEIYCEGCIYIVNVNGHTKSHVIDENFRYKITDLSGVPKDWLKILFAGPYERLLEVQKLIDGRYTGEVRYVFSCDHFFEVLPAGISKGTTLRRLSEMLGIPIQNVAAIGDYYNDAELIAAAGIGATVQGAPEELLKDAAFVAGPCANGSVADFIEYLEQSRIG